MQNRHRIIRNPFVREEEPARQTVSGVAEEEPRLSITDWALEDRPREKLMAKGADALSEAELLAILIGSGNARESAVDLMRRVMKDHDDSLTALGRMSLQELMAYKGVGEAKAVTIMAACELGKRRMMEQAAQRKHFDSSKDFFEVFRPRMMDLNVEQCHMLTLDVKLCQIGYHVVSTGGIASSQVDVRVVLRHALLDGATAVVFCHNHPSGNTTPSVQDDELTRRLRQACEATGLRLLDHIVLGAGDYFSYYDKNKL